MPAGPFLLLNPPSPPGTTANREGAGGLGVLVPGSRGFVYPALYLAEAAGDLARGGCAWKALDMVMGSRLTRRLPRLAAFSGVLVRVSLSTLEWDLEWVRALRRRAPGLPVVLGAPGFEGEMPEDLADLPVARGFFGGEAAALLGGGPRPDPEPDEWPLPEWRGLSLGRKRRLPVHHARGCTHGCTFCPYVVATGRRVIQPSAAHTAALVTHLTARLRPRRIVFRDPVFGIDPESTLELLERLQAAPPGVPFEVESRPDVLADEILEALGRAGCREIKLGVESLEPAALLTSGRVADPEAAAGWRDHVRRVIAFSEREGILLRIYLLSGLPGATREGDAATDAFFEGRPHVVRKQLLTWPRVGVAGVACLGG